LLADFADRLDAFAPGHQDVEQDEIERVARQLLEPARAVDRF
jgi:hypothetical protein